MIIEVTRHNGQPLFINIDHIVCFDDAPKNATTDRDLVLLYLAFGPNVTGYHIQGTAAELMEQVQEEELRGMEDETGAQHDYQLEHQPIGKLAFPAMRSFTPPPDSLGNPDVFGARPAPRWPDDIRDVLDEDDDEDDGDLEHDMRKETPCGDEQMPGQMSVDEVIDDSLQDPPEDAPF